MFFLSLTATLLTSFSTMEPSHQKKKKNAGWTVVTAKPRHKRVNVKLPPDLVKDLTPLEAAVYNVIRATNNGKGITAADVATIVMEEMNCSKSDVGNVLYGRLKPYIEADDWKERPRKWMMRKMKVKVMV